MLETIYITRHGFRSNWSTDNDGTITQTIASPTGIASDPPLAAYGVTQAKELAEYAATLSPPIDRIYSSPFYRCLETINPLAEKLDKHIYCENGIGEWYGVARWDHPTPASPELLHRFFPRVLTNYVPTIIPSTKGETLSEIHDRCAYAVARLITEIDREWRETGKGPRAILLVGHAASNIALGRALIGDENANIRTGTCSMSIYQRRTPIEPTPPLLLPSDGLIPDTNWRNGRGVVGGWTQVANGNCDFLTNGEERNWWFQGDESWDFPSLAAAPGTVPKAGKSEELVAEKSNI